MGRKARAYSRVDEADQIIADLCESQPDAMGFVRPATIAVMGIDNVERSKKNHVLAKIKAIKGCEKAIFQLNNIPVRYVIELFWSDWHTWTMLQKQWILFHELLHVHPDFEKTIKHDCEDFRIILDRVGVDWVEKKDTLPNLISGEVSFNLELRPGIKEIMGDDGDGGDEIIKDDLLKPKAEAPKSEPVEPVEPVELTEEKEESEIVPFEPDDTDESF